MLCTSVVLQLTWRVFRNSILVEKLESTVFKKKSSIEQDVIFSNPYRNRKSDEYQSL
ncbi:hypothetical protein MtrunA17_Chr4g0025801 [Medicago truncatula]|uniref:Uncharacterized protein n=1 Tax=Medicago truncatula TaxID=3880 RepID=A0A396I9W0_MEDTR|nr:hypothetical protein MtrunA17_Chr4g0025801 [Medicago truncatula]